MTPTDHRARAGLLTAALRWPRLRVRGRPARARRRAVPLGAVLTWPCVLATPIRIMSDTREPRPLLYDRAPCMAPATGIAGEAVMLIAPRRRGGSSAAVVGERTIIRDMAARGGRRVLEVATIDHHGCLMPAQRAPRRR